MPFEDILKEIQGKKRPQSGDDIPSAAQLRWVDETWQEKVDPREAPWRRDVIEVVKRERGARKR